MYIGVPFWYDCLNKKNGDTHPMAIPDLKHDETMERAVAERFLGLLEDEYLGYQNAVGYENGDNHGDLEAEDTNQILWKLIVREATPNMSPTHDFCDANVVLLQAIAEEYDCTEEEALGYAIDDEDDDEGRVVGADFANACFALLPTVAAERLLIELREALSTLETDIAELELFLNP